jgi:hypothetical protein
MSHLPLTRTLLAAALGSALGACSGSESTGPKKSTAPAAQLAEGEGYRRVYPTFATQSVIAASDLAAGSTTGRLQYLVKGAEAVQLSTKAETDAVLVAPAEPPSALFLDDPSNEGVGTLMFVDLAAKPPKAAQVKDGRGVPSDGVAYGADGNQVLFVAGFDSVSGLGALKWTNGTEVRNISEGGAAPASFAFSGSRATAVTVINIDASTLKDCTKNCGRGTLVAIDMKTGSRTNLASDVILRGLEGDLAFSISADGSTAAYTSGDGIVAVVPTSGGEPKKLPCGSLPESECRPTPGAKGGSPAISSDGKLVVFYYYLDGVPNSPSNGWFAWSDNNTVKLAGERAQSVRPVLSPDNRWVVYFKNVENKSGLVGEALIVPASGGDPENPLKLAPSVALDSVTFNAASARISLVGDLSGSPGYEYKGIGTLFVGGPGQALAKLGVGTQVFSAAAINATDSLAYIGGLNPGDVSGSLFVASGVDEAPTKIKDSVVPNSVIGRTLQVSKEFDAMIFLAEPADELFESRYRVGAVWGSTTKGPARVLTNAESDAIQAVFSRDGRANVVVVRGEKAGVWTLPTP